MSSRDLPRLSPIRFRCCTALAAGVLGILSGCKGVIGTPSDSETGGPGADPGGGTTTGSAARSGSAGSGGTTKTGAGGSSSPITGSAGSGSVAFAPGPGAYRRLTATAFKNSLRDLLGGAVTIGDLEQDSWTVGGFASVSAATVSITQTGVEDYQTAIDAATTQVFANTTRRDQLLGCKPQSATDTTCFQSFVKTFGRAAWRQPVTAAQLTRYTQLISSVASSMGDVYEGMRAGMSAILLSPNFLYRMERGTASPSAPNGFWQYTSSEVASRLSYFLTNSTPDKTLLDLADSNALQTADAVRQQADRLLTTTAGHESVKNFATELYQLGIIAARAKDTKMYPQYNADLQNGMAQEIPAMWEGVVFTQNGSVLDLLTTRNTYVNKDLAALYGLPTTGLTSATLSPATLPATGPRAGLLTTAGFLSLYASQQEGSPTQRGKFIRQTILCEQIPDPPANVNTMLPATATGTKRQKMTAHESVATCGACHKLMDPLGFPLENFDAIGAYRTTDQGLAIDASGVLQPIDGSPAPADSAFSSATQLGQVLAKQPEVANCLVQQFYRYGTGHVETDTEQPVLDGLKSQFQAGGYKVRDLLIAIVTSDGFRFVAPPQL